MPRRRSRLLSITAVAKFRSLWIGSNKIDHSIVQDSLSCLGLGILLMPIPAQVIPEWCFLCVYASLCSIPSKHGGVIRSAFVFISRCQRMPRKVAWCGSDHLRLTPLLHAAGQEHCDVFVLVCSAFLNRRALRVCQRLVHTLCQCRLLLLQNTSLL